MISLSTANGMEPDLLSAKYQASGGMSYSAEMRAPFCWTVEVLGDSVYAGTETGLAVSGTAYVRAHRARLAFREDVMPLLAAHDALLSPSAPAPAPAGLGWTGDAWNCAPWSFAGVPSVSLPSGVAASGLPLAIQLVQAADADARLLATARWCEDVLGFAAAPAL